MAEGAIAGGIAAKVKAPISAARQAYVDAARAIAARGAAREAAGQEALAVARAAVDERNALKVAAREGMPRVLNKLAEWRNSRVYGDPVGPSVDFLLARGKTAHEVIRSAGKTINGSTGFYT